MRNILKVVAPAVALTTGPARAQDVGAYLDYMDRLVVFDHGHFEQLEGQKPVVFKAGGNYLAYASYNGDLKVYYDGGTKSLERTTALVPTVTSNYLGYVLSGVLKAWEPGGSVRTLCYNTDASIVEDSLIAYYDGVNQLLNAYYHGKTAQLEDALASWPVANWKAGDNILAWVGTIDKKFKVFYRDEVYVLNDLIENAEYKAGLDVVAYQDAIDQGFKVFHQGRIHDVEPVMPTAYDCGMGLVAYLDQSNALKVFQNGKVYTATDFEPQFWQVSDSLVIIRDQNHFKVFHDGKVETIEPYWPEKWRASWSTVAYLDNTGNVMSWHNGQGATVFRNEPIQEFTLNRGLIIVTTLNSRAKVWWRGQAYSN